jgi:hypothetical protein
MSRKFGRREQIERAAFRTLQMIMRRQPRWLPRFLWCPVQALAIKIAVKGKTKATPSFCGETRRRSPSGKKRKRSDVLRADDGEVAAIQCGDYLGAESFGERHDGCIHRPERQIVVARYELRDPHPIAWQDGRGSEVSGRKVAEEPYFCFPS